jgi:predicted histone-like DNA-binding protein
MKYKVIARKNPRNPEEPQKYYAHIVRPDKISLDELALRISEISPVSELDTKSVLIAFTKVLPEFFLKGASIDMGDLGYFQATIKSGGAEVAEDFISDMIKNFKVSYHPSPEVKDKFKTVKYTKVQAQQ